MIIDDSKDTIAALRKIHHVKGFGEPVKLSSLEILIAKEIGLTVEESEGGEYYVY